MSRAKSSFGALLLFAIAARVTANQPDDDERRCQVEDKCFVDIHSDHDPECHLEDDNQIMHYMRPVDGGLHRIPNACRRSNVFSGDGYVVAYPSTGGLVFLKDPSAVDLKYLELPNTHDAARSTTSDEAEDELALRMVQIGAQWWPDWDLYFRHSHAISETQVFYDYHFPSQVEVAFPSTGGVWVANFTQDSPRFQHEHESPCKSWLPYAPDMWRRRLKYALSMDDKSKLIKETKSTFHGS